MGGWASLVGLKVIPSEFSELRVYKLKYEDKHRTNPQGYKPEEDQAAQIVFPRSGWQKIGENRRLLRGRTMKKLQGALLSHTQTAITQKVCF